MQAHAAARNEPPRAWTMQRVAMCCQAHAGLYYTIFCFLDFSWQTAIVAASAAAAQGCALSPFEGIKAFSTCNSAMALSSCYASGIGVEKDPKKAEFWFRKSGLLRHSKK
jgi:TPR repeat protein